MTSSRLFAAAAGAAISIVMVGPAAAELTPWQKFCLKTKAPGEEIARCLDGLPSVGGPNQVLVSPGGPDAGPAFRSNRTARIPATPTNR
jgi:hypothetical protein